MGAVRLDASDAHHARESLARGLELVPNGIVEVHDLAGAHLQEQSGLGRRHAFPGARKELGAVFALEFLYASGERRLRDVQALGSAGEAACFFLTRRTTTRLCRKCWIRSDPSPVIHFHAQPCMIRMDQETAKRPRAWSLRAFGKEASEPYIRARSASTSSSVVAQLVARRTIVWLSSGFSQKLRPTFSQRVWYLSSGSLTKVWFVVELKRS